MDNAMIGGLIHIIGGSLIFATILFVGLSSQFTSEGGHEHSDGHGQGH